MYYELTDHFIVASDAEKTWAFFSSADNLPDITPPKMQFRIVSPQPIQMKNDTLLDYTLRVNGLPVRWRTRIIDWSPPHQFIDLQLRGPYTLWHHQHTFVPVEQGVRCRDRVIYKLPAGLVGRAVHRLVVKQQLLEVFRFRRKIVSDRLGWVRSEQDDVEIRRLG